MKISRINSDRHNEHGMVTFVFIALLAIMLLLVMANGKSLLQLHREIKLLEQQQIKRLNASQTNSVAVTNLNTK
jgi:Tfp pilus assembly protein FimT